MLIKYREFIHTALTLLVAAFLLHPSIILASEQSQTSLQQGIEAYEAGEYEKALEYFAEAVRLGSTKTGLYYNIGVAHYRLAQYEAADEAFKKVAQSPEWEPLALYNRALIAYRRNQLDLARELATKSIDASKRPEVSALSYRLLDVIDNNGREKSAWSNLMHFGVGFDDNVILKDAGTSAISGKGDAYLEFFGRARRAVALQGSGKLNFLMQASVRDYAKLNEYDQIGVRGGIEKELGSPDSTVGAYLEHVALDGRDYELISTLEYRHLLANRKNSSIEFTYQFNHYNMLDSNYAQLGGDRHRVRLTRKKKLKKGSIRTYIRAEYNDREDQKITGDFYSFSPVRLGAGTDYTRYLSAQALFSGSLYLQQSHYLDPDKRGAVLKTREDGFLEFRLRLAHITPKRWIYRVNYMHTINDSNYAEFSYKQNVVSFELLKSF